MRINLEWYRVFITVADEGSFTRAAEALALTQSAVSQAVRQLEKALDTQLFVRTAKGAALSPAGEMLLQQVGGILPAAQSAENYFAKRKNLAAGTLRIGASDTLCRHILLDVLEAYHQAHPAVELQVTNRTSGETVELLRRARAEIGFVNLPLEDVAGLVVQPLADVQDCFVCGEKYFADFTRPVPLEALAAYPLLMLEPLSASRRWLDQTLRRLGVPLKPQIELGSLDLLTEFAIHNMGVAAVTQEFLGGALQQGSLRMVPLTTPLPRRQVALLTRREVPLSPAGQAFMDMLPQGSRFFTKSRAPQEQP